MLQLERRTYDVDVLEIRDDGDGGQSVEGLAVPVNRKSMDLGGFQEVIRPGAFASSLRDNDIFILWQHRTEEPISRMSATSHPLELEERKSGLWFKQPVGALTEFQRQKIGDGVVTQMSFGFIVREETWHEDKKPVLREVTDMDLKEISPVTFAAYGANTKVALRHAAECGITISPVSREADSDAAAVEHWRWRMRVRERMAMAAGRAVAHTGDEG